MNLKELEIEIYNLISSKTEGDYWDFKLEWHENKPDLLIDIISMANNLVNRDAYIIIGVEDETGIIKGNIGSDPNRKNQQFLVNFLRDKKFAGGYRPTVYLHTFNDEIDVIVIKNSTNTPFYLKEDYQGIFKGNIYVREQDGNTPKTSTADIDKTSFLWRKRFGIDLTPFEKAKFLLGTPKDWLPMGTDGKHSTSNESCKRVWFNKKFPEFTLSYSPKYFSGEYDQDTTFKEIDKIDQNFYWLAAIPKGSSLGQNSLHNTYYWDLSLKYLNTTLYSTPMITADNFRFERVQWKNQVIKHPKLFESSIIFSYIEMDSIDFLLDNWLSIKRETIPETIESSDRTSLSIEHLSYFTFSPYTVVPVFKSTFEKKEFMSFIDSKVYEFFEEVGIYRQQDSSNFNKLAQAYDPNYIQYLCKVGKVIVEWLHKWRDTSLV